MRAIIFDFDGTIADSFDTVVKIAYELTGKPQLSNVELVKFYRDQHHNGLKEAMHKLELQPWKWPWLLHRGKLKMSKIMHHVPIFPGLAQVLKHLAQDEHYELYIVSTNSTKNVERFLLEKGLLTYFRQVYGGAGLLNKAHLIKKVLHKRHLQPAETVYVGDEVRDVVAAKSLDMPCIAVTWGYNSAELLETSSPTLVAHTTAQLEKMLIEWGRTI